MKSTTPRAHRRGLPILALGASLVCAAPPLHAQGPGGPPPGYGGPPPPAWSDPVTTLSGQYSEDYWYQGQHYQPSTPWDLGRYQQSGGFVGTASDAGQASSVSTKPTITVTRTWQGTGDPPKKVYILETGSASGSGGVYGPGGNGSGSADDGLGDKPVPTADGSGQVSSGKHLFQMDGSSTISRSSSPTAGGNSAASPGSSSGQSLAMTTFGWDFDPRAVGISSGIETSYYKYTGSTPDSNRFQHQRNEDDSISVDSVLQWQEASPNNPAGWVVNDFPFTANAANFNSPTYSWTASGQGNVFYPSRQTATFSLLVPGDGSFPAHSTLTVNVTDSDGAIGTNTYDVTWHLPAENWTAATPGAPYLTVIPSSGEADTCIKNDSVSGQWSYPEDSQGASISLGDMFSAASGLVDPPYAAFLAAAGIVFSKTQPEQSPVKSVVFNDAWGSPYSSFDPQPQDNSLDHMSEYKMAPLLALTYQHQEYNGDQYDVHGYAGPTSEGFEQVIKAEGCGNFTPIK